MRKVNLNEVSEAKEGSRPQAGGYICKITKVEDLEDKEYLRIEYDIAKGDYEGYYQGIADKFGYWGASYIRSYKEKALPFFKRFCSAVSKSNNGYVFDGNTNADEQTLVGKLIGLVLGEEEYVGNNGELKTRLYVYNEMAIDNIVNEKFKVPALKKLPEDQQPKASNNTSASFMEVENNGETTYPFG